MDIENLIVWCDLFGDMAAADDLSNDFSKITLSSPMPNYYRRSIQNINPYLDTRTYIPMAVRKQINEIIMEFFSERVREDPFSHFLDTTQRYVKVDERKRMKDELKAIEKTTTLQRSPRLNSTDVADEWPIVYEKSDLLDGSGAFLRDEIAAFLEKCVSGDCTIDIRFNVDKMILITVPIEEAKTDIIDRLGKIEVSEDQIPPLDVIAVVVEKIPRFPCRNEMLSILSGSVLLGKGTIGLILCHQKEINGETTREYFATTARHVVRGEFKGNKALSKYLEISSTYSLRTDSVDFQALRISDEIINKCDIRNIVKFEPPLGDSVFPQLKDPVWKFGASTGWTEGQYGGTLQSVSIPSNDVKYKRAHLVRWISDIPFASSGDCGSIYFFRDTDGKIQPFAYHVNSDDNQFSYGLNLADGLSLFEGMFYLFIQLLIIYNILYRVLSKFG